MASLKESQAIRPQSSHRFPINSTPPSNVPTRNSTTRHHSHSISLGAVNSSHRVTRRKSMNAAGANSAAAVVAALQEDGHGALHRRNPNLRNTGTRGLEPCKGTSSSGERWPLVDGFSSNGILMGDAGDDDSAVADDFLSSDHARSASKTKPRRASEGSYLTKGENKRSSGELRCTTCGKGYKHSSCLTKHKWEHHEAWSYTSKLLISKHQQVQLLEAAQVLVGMNQDGETVPDTAKTTDSDNSSASPAASGSSDIREDDDYSSAETTPPPMGEQYHVPDRFSQARGKRYSGNSLSFSRSYQSAPSSSLPAGSIFNHYHSQRRPSSSGIAAPADEEEAGLAAAVASLCSFGTPRTGPVLLPADVPPVPPLPAQYAEQNANRLSGYMGAFSEYGLPVSNYHRLSVQRDIDMDDRHDYERQKAYESDEKSVHGSRNDEDDEGIFGNMEGVSHEPHGHA